MAKRLPVYIASGEFPAGAVIAMAAVCGGGVLLGIGYSEVLGLTASMYAIAGIVAGACLAVAVACTAAVRAGKGRSPGRAAVGGALAGLATWLSAHGWSYYREASRPSGPATIADYLNDKRATGWRVSKWGSMQRRAMAVRGPGVDAAWLSEALALATAGIIGAVYAATRPFCEPCGRWASAPDVSWQIQGATKELRKRLNSAATVADVLDVPLDALHGAGPMLWYTTENCPSCGLMPTLTVRYGVPKKKGKSTDYAWATLYARVLLAPAEYDALVAMKVDAEELARLRAAPAQA